MHIHRWIRQLCVIVKQKQTIIPLLIAIAWSLTANTNARFCVNRSSANLYCYGRHEIDSFLLNRKLENVRLERNYTGDKLLFKPLYNSLKMFVLNMNGDLVLIEQPASIAYLNEKDEFVIWTNDLKKEINFWDGSRTVAVANLHLSCIDLSGRYFVASTNSGSEIRETMNPEKSLFLISGHPDSIYSKNGKIYLFETVTERVPYSMIKGIHCEVYSHGSEGVVLQESFFIKRPSGGGGSPFLIEDFDNNWSDVMVIRDVTDTGIDDFYLFDLKQKNLQKLGSFDGQFFFLKSDILTLPPKVRKP